MNSDQFLKVSTWVDTYKGALNILDNVKMYIFIKDLHNNVVWLNKSFALAIGKPQETLIKCTVEELFSGCSEVVDINSYLADDLEVINSKIPKCDFIEKLPTLTKTLWVKTTKIPIIPKVIDE